MRLPRATYTNVTATLALFVALGGSAYAAASFTGADIRNGTVRGSDVKDGSLKGRDVGDGAVTGSDVASGSLTGSDVASLAGADLAAGQLAAGPVGPAGPAGITDVITRRAAPVTLDPNDRIAAAASCQAGEIAVGGGAGQSGTTAELIDIEFDGPLEADGSLPEDGEPATQWHATGFNSIASPGPLDMTVYALCARP